MDLKRLLYTIATFLLLFCAVDISAQYSGGPYRIVGDGTVIAPSPYEQNTPIVMAVTGSVAIPARVQGTYSSSTGATPALSYTSDVTLNHLLLAIAIMESGSNLPTGVTDTLGNTYTMCCTAEGYGIAVVVYYAISAFSGADAVTVNWGSGSAYTAVIIREWSGVNTTDPFDGGAALNQQNATPGTATSGSFTPNVNGDLIYALTVATHGSMSISAGSGFTVGQGPLTLWGSANQAMDEYMVQPVAGSTAGTFMTATDQGGMYQLTLALALRPAGTTRNVVPSVTSLWSSGATSAGNNSISNGAFSNYQPALGEVVFVAATWAGQALTVTSISDGNVANVYTPVFSTPVNFGDGVTVGQVWYCVIKGNTGQGITLTLSGNAASGTADGILIDIFSAQKVSISNPIDASTRNYTTGYGTSLSVTSGTPTTSKDLLFAVFLMNNYATPFSNYNWAGVGSDAVSSVNYLNATSASQETATISTSANIYWVNFAFGLMPMSN